MNKSLLGGWLLVAVVSVGCNCSAPPVAPKLLPEGEKCTNDQACETGLCDSLPETPQVCVRPCSSVCHPDEVCTQLSPGKFSCAPDNGGLCQACQFDSDCAYPSDRCIVVDGASICGRDCAYDQKCPDKYRCMNAVGTDGKAKSQQCAPATGTCQCTVGQGMAEICNGLDDDCDGKVDNGFDQNTDVANCGACGNQCMLENATPKCQAGVCHILTCTAPFQNCDNVEQNGCETDTTTVNNCGACGNKCAFANASPRCESNQCKFTCLPGFIDLNGVAADGCEYQCTPTTDGGVDLPDLMFNDANCDGIDGEWNNGIFVAPAAGGGATGNSGDRQHPLATINAAIAAAVSQGKRDVYVASGTYPGQVTMTNVHGIIVAGGYSLPDWKRSLNNTTTVGPANPGLQIEGTDGGTVQFVTVQGANPTTPGANAYGAWVKNSANVRLEGLTLSAGSGSNGAPGTSALPAGDGQPGQPGQNGATHDPDLSLICAVTTTPPAVGPGGTNTCSRPGGRGGAPGWSGNASPTGSAGQVGSGVTPAGAGAPGSQGNWTVPAQYNGQNGASGADGSNGAGASGLGTLTATGYVGPLAQAGTAGLAGFGGGGGGGGGGGCAKSLGGVLCLCFSYGSAGGGGGAAGCGGPAGLAGQAGGASIGLYSWNSRVTLASSTVLTANSGNGGSGGTGSAGGTGAPGAASNFDLDAQGTGSKGGKGGNGGNGGRGGHGGGGMGGANFGIVSNAASQVNTTGVSFVRGQPGTGGTSMGNAGQNGASTDVQTF